MKTKMMLRLFTIIGIGLLLNSCSSLKVTSNFDSSADFTALKTYEYYGWAQDSDKILNGLDKVRIEDAFAQEFSRRGMKLVKEGGDLVVTLLIVVEDRTERTAHTTGMGGGYAGYGGYYGGYYGYGPGWGYGSGYSTTTVSEYNYKVGTLVCDVFDKAKETLIWEGIANKTIDDPKKREKNIPYIVKKMMARYPVPVIKEK